nr:shikimate dehydrogenase [uncultured Merdimonas sp.]
MFEITGHTQLICLLGSPVAHSISPMMHNEAFRLLNLPYAYLAFDVKPEELRTAVDGLKALGAKGFNLTMPHKNAMARMADQLSPAASLCGAVNTIVIKDGVLTGHTTDGAGYMRAASEAGYPLPGKVMTLLGAGGAATSILVQAALDGVKEIRVFNRKGRNYEKAEALIEKLNQKTGCKVTIHDLKDEEALGESILTSQVLTNGTNVGMAPHEEECIIRDFSVFHKDLVVSDAIYNPRETKLMRLARDCGCPAFNGLYMLLYQGAESFRLWTGCEMPVDEIRKKYFA